MAEIKIEQKKQNWPWIIVGIVIVAILVYFIAFRDNNNNNSNTIDEETETKDVSQGNESDLLGVKENNNAVASFVSFMENDTTRMSLDHTYTNEALLKLVEATNTMANEVGYEVRADLEKVKEYANMISKAPFETTHANNIRKANDILTNVLENIQMARYPGLTDEVEELKSASASINPEVLTLEQKDEVRNYFAKASDLLKKMNRP